MSRSRHTPAAQGGKWLRGSLRWAIYYRDGFACIYCGGVDGTLSIDHVTSAKHGGRDHSAKNLVTACLRCNSAKKSLTPRAWYARLRERGIEPKTVQQRIRRHTRHAVNRLVGRFLALATMGPMLGPPEE